MYNNNVKFTGYRRGLLLAAAMAIPLAIPDEVDR